MNLGAASCGYKLKPSSLGCCSIALKRSVSFKVTPSAAIGALTHKV